MVCVVVMIDDVCTVMGVIAVVIVYLVLVFCVMGERVGVLQILEDFVVTIVVDVCFCFAAVVFV